MKESEKENQKREGDFFKMEHWQRIQETVQKSIKKSEFITWIAPLNFDKIDLDTLYINAPTQFFAGFIKRNFFSVLLSATKQFYPNINDIKINIYLKKVTNLTSDAVVVSDEKFGNNLTCNQNGSSDTFSFVKNDENYVGTKPNNLYTFENFITDKSNEFAFAGIKQIIENDEVKYNPVVVHSNKGLGKTHLLNAIANDFEINKPQKRVIYISAMNFMYSFIKSLKENDAYRFKESFKNGDVLIIDDLQFIAGKDASARELFQIMHTYIESGKQVVIACNNSPLLIPGLDENLKSLLSSGIILDIANSTYNLRLKIINEKCRKLKINLESGVSEYIATKISTSIKELEGALNRISFFSTLHNNEILSFSFVRKLLKDIFAVNTKPVSIDDIKKVVAEKYNITVADINSVKKQKHIAFPRQVAMYIAKTLTTKSLPDIGRVFGGRDHATVIYAVKKVQDLMTTNPKIETIINEIQTSCGCL